MPRLVRDLIERALRAAPDMTVVGVLTSPAELLPAARETRPHFVVVGLDNSSLPPECRLLLEEQPRTKMLGIESRAGEAHLYELRPHRIEIGEVAPPDVVVAIREAAAQPLFPANEGVI